MPKKRTNNTQNSEQPKVEIKKTSEEKTVVKQSIVLTENDLLGMDSKTLERVAIVYGINGERNKKRKIEKILEEQSKYLKEKECTPQALISVVPDQAVKQGMTTVGISTTINMGNYRSLKLEAGITLPIFASVELKNQAVKEMEETLTIVKEFLENEIPKAKDEFDELLDR